MSDPESTEWSIDDARDLYAIRHWGLGYFDINDAGNVVAKPQMDAGAQVELKAVIEEAQSRGLQTPLLIRFQDILRHRVEAINGAFTKAIEEQGYKNRYRGVFPVKVNHLREVVEELKEAGSKFDFGLEVGSKPELFAVMALQDQLNDLIICNGYKDAKFINMALMGTKLGKKVVIVVEKLEELHQVVAISRQVGVEPSIGIRVRLQTKSQGIWAESGGENAKFGLSSSDLLSATEYLETAGLKHCLNLIHFHIGSQVPDIQAVKRAVQEGARFFAKVKKMGFGLEFVDVGGGLGIDYDGSQSSCESSTNYTLQEYANDVVYAVMSVCDQESVEHPVIVSESGRALVAHHSILVIEVFGSTAKLGLQEPVAPGEDDHDFVKELLYIRNNLNDLNPAEAYHDAKQFREDALTLFTLGHLGLKDRARIDQLYWEIAHEIVSMSTTEETDDDYVPEEFAELRESMSDQYLCNFSVFQSLLDHWALGQLFPIVPVGHHSERPSRETTLVDITCDSDGHIDKFIDPRSVKNTLPLHPIHSKEGNKKPYHLGLFLMGAYQDIMGDLHNLFGKPNEVHVFLDPDEPAGYYVEEVIEGSTIRQVLESVQYDDKALRRQMKQQVDKAIKEDRLKPSEGMRLLQAYDKGLKEYTYLTF